MHRLHDMPFGAEIIGPGHARFRLWAPSADSVELCLGADQAERGIAMHSANDGWFSLEAEYIEPGLYRFRIDGDLRVPDPASRYQPNDLHGPSQIIDPRGFDWQDVDWRGRPWEDAVFYELHVGAFTSEGTFNAVEQHLDYLMKLGVTAVELMPVADFPGTRNWGYDGVLPFAPDSRYGAPDDLKHLVQTAHAKGLMVFLDVVYNHFGPDGNYLHAYAKDFFTERYKTPWGAAINFDGEQSRAVRDFFIHNALYWLEEYHFDGLRLDAVHAIADASQPHILVELAQAVQAGPGKHRHIHLVLENDDNAARFLKRDDTGQPQAYVAQWNDDMHHVFHTVATGERAGYYADYADRPIERLAHGLTQGFVYQGEASAYREGKKRGEKSSHLPPTAFVNFLQNHDQVGNRALGERIGVLASPEALRAVTAILLLSPMPPLLFMGQEWACDQPFPFFCDFEGELADKVKEGRRQEFAAFPEFKNPATRNRIPDPGALETYKSAILDWTQLELKPHDEWLKFHRRLLDVRHREITPRLRGAHAAGAGTHTYPPTGLCVHWQLGDGARLSIVANLGADIIQDIGQPDGDPLFMTAGVHLSELAAGLMPSWSVACFLEK
ncbi:MAG: malto-oligosyltrehalose trehalohydrolase [Gammaproteobacteria bacterium]|nr:malto-oligosyltrehalose trehalohydrolase [Gammaproteobacteria bacterium]